MSDIQTAETAPDEQGATDDTRPDEFVTESVARAVKLAVRAERGRTRSNLGIAAEMIKSIEHALLTVCRSSEDVQDWRTNTVNHFSMPISRATGLSLTVAKLSEFLKVYYLTDSLPSDVKPMAERVNWESLRVLARWITHQPGETLWSVGEAYAEEWLITPGCEERLVELIKSLNRKPLSPGALRKVMDKFEAELNGGTVAETPSAFAIRAGFIASLRKSARMADASGSDVLAWMIEDGFVTLKTIHDVVTHALANSPPPKSAGPVTMTLNATSVPNDNPLAAARTRKIA